MNMELTVPAITAVCCLIGALVKLSPIPDRWIPCIVGAAGGLLGLAGRMLVPSFPVSDPLSALAVGIFPYALPEGARMHCATIASRVGGIPV